MEILTVFVVLAALGLWLFAVVSWIAALVNRRPDVPLSGLLLSGVKSFDSDNFTDVGQKHQRRFMVAFVAFFVLCLAAILVAAIMQ